MHDLNYHASTQSIKTHAWWHPTTIPELYEGDRDALGIPSDLLPILFHDVGHPYLLIHKC